MNNNKYCKFCHTGNPSDANWCRNCGGLFPEDETRHEKLNKNQSANKAPVRKKTSNKKKKLWLLLLIPVVLFGLVCLVSYIRLANFDIYNYSIALSPEGGSRKIYFESHGCGYWVYGEPSWMEILSKSSSGLQVKYESNNTGLPRSGYIKIQALNWFGSKDYSIFVHQKPNN